jgi:hypothetical protein
MMRTNHLSSAPIPLLLLAQQDFKSGIIGCAIAYILSIQGDGAMVLEKERLALRQQVLLRPYLLRYDRSPREWMNLKHFNLQIRLCKAIPPSIRCME